MSSWPSTLPQKQFQGVSVQDDESRLISQMDAGPASIRNRFTAVPQTVTTRIVLTGEEYETFKTFLRTTLNHGTNSFDWTDPGDGTTVTFRFRQKPTFTCIKTNSDPDLRLWEAVLNLEILP